MKAKDARNLKEKQDELRHHRALQAALAVIEHAAIKGKDSVNIEVLNENIDRVSKMLEELGYSVIREERVLVVSW